MIGWLVTAALAGDVSGKFEVVDPPERVQATVDAAVDKAASQFGIFRGIARRKMAGGATWCRSYTLSPDPSSIGWQCDDKPRFEVPRDRLGKSRTLEIGDGQIEARVDVQGQDIHAWFGGEEGGRRQVFRFEGDDTLVCDVSVESPKLPEPMTWTIRYRRVE